MVRYVLEVERRVGALRLAFPVNRRLVEDLRRVIQVLIDNTVALETERIVRICTQYRIMLVVIPEIDHMRALGSREREYLLRLCRDKPVDGENLDITV